MKKKKKKKASINKSESKLLTQYDVSNYVTSEQTNLRSQQQLVISFLSNNLNNNSIS